jgi:hypothetical protein
MDERRDFVYLTPLEAIYGRPVVPDFLQRGDPIVLNGGLGLFRRYVTCRIALYLSIELLSLIGGNWIMGGQLLNRPDIGELNLHRMWHCADLP